MLAYESNGHNGYDGSPTFLICESDYPEAPIYDVVPSVPAPKWRDQLAPVTWSMSYIDSSSISHSVTLRGDTEEEVMAMVKPLVVGIRKAKEKGVEQPAETGDVPVCKIHGVQMERRISKKNGKPYASHLTNDGLCFGREKK